MFQSPRAVPTFRIQWMFALLQVDKWEVWSNILNGDDNDDGDDDK